MWWTLISITLVILTIVLMVLIFQSYSTSTYLHEIRSRVRKLYAYLEGMETQTPTDAYLKELQKKLLWIKWKVDYDNSASFTTNKKVITLCLRSKNTDQYHKINLLTYVALHELAHVACPEEGHTQLFKDIFQRLIQVSVDAGIYQLEDYHSSPVEYCGMVLRDCDRCLFDTKKPAITESSSAK